MREPFLFSIPKPYNFVMKQFLFFLLALSFLLTSCKDSETISEKTISEKLTKVPSFVNFFQNDFEMNYKLDKQEDNVFVEITKSTFFDWPAYEIYLEDNGGFNINGEIICKDGKLTKYYEYDHIQYLEDRINFTTDNDEVLFTFHVQNNNVQKYISEDIVYVNGDPFTIKREIELTYSQKINSLNPFWAKYRFNNSKLQMLDLVLFFSENIPESGTETMYYDGVPSTTKNILFDFQSNSDNSITEYTIGIENVESITWGIEY